MSKDKITVVLLEPDKLARVAEIDGSLHGLQQTVGGYIEAVYPFETPECLVCNEEGKISGLPLNRALHDENGDRILDIIAGPCFICDCSGEDFASLSEEKLSFYCEKFKLPELFFRLPNGQIKAVPYEPEEEKASPSLSSKLQAAKTKASNTPIERPANNHGPER